MLKLKLHILLSKKNILTTLVLLLSFALILILISIHKASIYQQILNYENYKEAYIKFFYLFIYIFSILNLSLFLYNHDITLFNELTAYIKRKNMFLSKLVFHTVLTIIITTIYVFIAIIISSKNIYFFLSKDELLKVFSIIFDNLIFTYIILLFIRKNKKQLIFLFLTIFIIINLIYLLLEINTKNINFYYLFSLSNIYLNPYNYIFTIFFLNILIVFNYLKSKYEKINI